MQPWRKVIKSSVYDLTDLECLLEKMHSCQNNPEKSYTEKKLSIHLLITHCLEIVNLMKQKINSFVLKVKTLWKGLVKVVCFRYVWDSFLLTTFLIFKHIKKRTYSSHIFLPVPTTSIWSLFILKNNYIYNCIKKVYSQIWKYSHDPFSC